MSGVRTGAVIYCRVSTDEQVKGTSLVTQEATCRAWCERNGLEVLKVFCDAGASAKTADRPQFQAAIEWCREHKGKAARLVVYKLDRFARQTHDHHIFRALLVRYGVQVQSATEPMGDDPAGQLLENVLASIAQFDNQVRAERTRAAMRSLASQGWWVWRAPTGYRTARADDGKPTLETDTTTAATIARGFEDLADGRRNSVQIADAWNAAGMSRHDGGSYTSRHVIELMRQPVYAGFYRGRMSGSKDTTGRWPAIVHRDLWERAQAIIGGALVVHSGYLRANEDFPLRGFVQCGQCGRPMTGSWSKGRSGRYAYYHCPGGCAGARVARQSLHEAWCSALDDTTEIYKPVIVAIREIIGDVVRHRLASSIIDLEALKSRVMQIEHRIETLLDRLLDRTIDRDTYLRRRDALDGELAAARAQKIDAELVEVDAESVVDLAAQCVSTLRDVWECQSVGNRQRFQRAIFPGGLRYLKTDGFGTVASASIFAGLVVNSEVGNSMAPHTGIVWNRIIQLGSALRSVEDLIRCA